MTDPHKAREAAADAFQAIGQLILEAVEMDGKAWDSASLGYAHHPGMAACSAYVYDGDGNPRSLCMGDLNATFTAFRALRDALGEADGETFAGALVALSRADMQLRARFDFDDPDAFRVTPETMDWKPRTLRIAG